MRPMREARSPWVNILAALVGLVMLVYGAFLMTFAVTLVATVWAVLGFLVLGWAVLSWRRFRRGTPESEIDGGHTIE